MIERRSVRLARPGTLRPYYALRAVGELANQVLQFAVPVLIYQATGSAAWSGIALLVEWLPRLTSLPLAGPLVDRFQVRRVHLVSDMVRGLAAWAAVVSLAVAPGTAQACLLGLALICGACFEQTFIAGEKTVRLLATASEMPRAQSVLGAIDQLMLLAGPALGGVLLLAGDTAVVLAVAVSFAVSLVLAWTILPRRNAAPVSPVATVSPVESLESLESPTAVALWAQLARGARAVFAEPILRTVMLITVCVNLGLGLILAAAPAIVVQEFGQPASSLGLVYTLAGLASLAVLPTTARLVTWLGLLRTGQLSAVGACALVALVGVAPGFGAFALLVAGFTAAESVFTVFIRIVRARVLPVRGFGSAVGMIVVLNFASVPVAGLLVAVFGHRLPLPHLVGITGVGCLVLVLALLRRLARLMPQHRAPDRQWVIPALPDQDGPGPQPGPLTVAVGEDG